MDGVFTMPYPELTVARELSKFLKKKGGYSVSIPLSRQQKGFDLLVYNSNSRKTARVQVKASQSYQKSAPKRPTKKERYQYYFWFNNFEHEPGESDFYVLFGLYPKDLSKNLKRRRTPEKWWAQKVLLFNDREMAKFLAKLRSKSGGHTKFFSFGFNDRDKEIFLTRGNGKNEPRQCGQFLIDGNIKRIQQFLR